MGILAGIAPKGAVIQVLSSLSSQFFNSSLKSISQPRFKL